MKKILLMFLAEIAFCVSAQARSVDLNGAWQFRFEEGKALEEVADPAFHPTGTMAVPCCFDMMPEMFTRRGTGLYRKTFELESSVKGARIIVDGMGLRGRFLIDGKDLGTVAMPYSRFELSTGPLAAGKHTVFAALDNRFDAKKMKLFWPYYDFYAFGGFYHGVSLVLQTVDTQLDRVFVRTKEYTTGTIELELTFLGTAPADFNASVRFDEETSARRVLFRNSRAVLSVPKFKLWSPESPNLHTVYVSALGVNQMTRFGIRQIKAEKKRLWLNGAPLYLRGANRHESHPQFGAATPDALMVQDIQLLKSIGGNFFRGCHYSQAQRFLDYCDEEGILVWEESLGWGNGKKIMCDPEFIRLQKEQTRLMVRNSFNHPSVIIFSFLNEFESNTKEGKALADILIQTIRNEDSGRLVTYACNHTGNDIANEKTDLVSFNTYPGWIGSDAGDPGNLKNMISNHVNQIVKNFRNLYPDKPIIVSEMGTCGIYGQHEAGAAQWTEEFEAEYDGDVVDAVFANPEICGLTLWQFTDSRSYHRGGATIRTKPLAMNLAGLYDGFRRPKAVVSVIREKFARHADGEKTGIGKK